MSLDRFIRAQAGGIYQTALAELIAGEKTTHWMWFVLPQIKGLGQSRYAWFYGLDDLTEATAYRDHPLLGPRLVACVEGIGPHHRKSADSVLGPIDARKFQSCLTLFAHTPGAPALFSISLERFFDGSEDAETLARLQISPASGLDGSA